MASDEEIQRERGTEEKNKERQQKADRFEEIDKENQRKIKSLFFYFLKMNNRFFSYSI